MANVTATAGHSGSVEMPVQLEDGDEKPLALHPLSVTLFNLDMDIAPATSAVERVVLDRWLVRMTAEVQGKWSLSSGINLTKDDRIDKAAPILVK